MTDIHAMLDTESTGLIPWRHAITSFALVEFDLTEMQLPDNSNDLQIHHNAIGYRTGVTYEEDYDTMQFREKHGIDATESRLNKFTQLEFLRWFSDRVQRYKYIWAKPTTFDMTFIAVLYDRHGLRAPWHHRQLRDVYTFIEDHTHMDPNDYLEKIPFIGTRHDAKDDALHQAKCVIFSSQFGGEKKKKLVFTP